MADAESNNQTVTNVVVGSNLEYKKQSPVERLVKLRKNPSRNRSPQSLTESLMRPSSDLDEQEFKDKLEAGGDPNGDPQKWRDWRPIFWAATSGNYKILALLLADSRTIVDAVDQNGYTALHHAVISCCRKEYADDRFYRCIDMLMDNQKVKLNMPDRKGYTAIGRAVFYPNKKCIEHILKHPLSNLLHLDYYPIDRNYTVREALLKNFPDLQLVLPLPLCEDISSNDYDRRVLATLQHGHYNSFYDAFQSSNPNPWYEEPYYSHLLELACQIKDRENFVELILRHGVNPNTKHRISGMPLLHMAVQSGNLRVLEQLLKHKNIDASFRDVDGRTVLHWLARIHISEQEDKQTIERCFEYLLSTESHSSSRFYSRRVDIDDKDFCGNTALHIAIERENHDRVILLLRNGANVMITKHGNPILFSISTSALDDILDSCIDSNNEPLTSKDFKITYKFGFLSSMLIHMSESAHLRDLLRHPVISTFLSLKWRHIKALFFIDLIFYILFVVFLTAYILFSDLDIENSDTVSKTPGKYSTSGANFDNSAVFNHRVISYTLGDTAPEYFWYPLIVLLGMLAAREIFQLFNYGKAYFLSPENWMELLLISTTLVSCSGFVSDKEIKLHCSAVAILLAWVELVLLSGRLPILSVQLEMLQAVSLTFLRFMAGYILLIVAFALSFYLIFRKSLDTYNEDVFGNPYISILKTIVMFTGELEASSLEFSAVPYTSHVIFLLFVFLVAIVLLNLLNGLAVNDTEVIRNNAEILSLVARVKLISKIENVLSALPKFIVEAEKLEDKDFYLYPNRPHSVEDSAIRASLRLIDQRRRPYKKRHCSDNNERWDVVMEKLSALQVRQEDLENKFEARLQKIQQSLNQILSHLEKSEQNEIPC